MVGFAVAMYVTPGPNNSMLATSSANHGVRATLPHMLGISVGFAAMLLIVAAAAGSFLALFPTVAPIVRWGGGVWILWLAWQIATAPPESDGGPRNILGFFGAMAFQWVNPKGWMIAIAVATEFARPDLPLIPQLILIGIVFIGVSIPCMLPWIALGRWVGGAMRRSGRLRAFNIAMGVLLGVSVVPLLLEW